MAPSGFVLRGSPGLGAVRRAVDVPLIGLIKRAYPGFEPYITATAREFAEVAATGSDVVAFDATGPSAAGRRPTWRR